METKGFRGRKSCAARKLCKCNISVTMRPWCKSLFLKICITVCPKLVSSAKIATGTEGVWVACSLFWCCLCVIMHKGSQKLPSFVQWPVLGGDRCGFAEWKSSRECPCAAGPDVPALAASMAVPSDSCALLLSLYGRQDAKTARALIWLDIPVLIPAPCGHYKTIIAIIAWFSVLAQAGSDGG